jgi:hypothetical protein
MSKLSSPKSDMVEGPAMATAAEVSRLRAEVRLYRDMATQGAAGLCSIKTACPTRPCTNYRTTSFFSRQKLLGNSCCKEGKPLQIKI